MYKPQTDHLVNSVFHKVHIGRMSGDKYGLTPSQFASSTVEVFPSGEPVTHDQVLNDHKEVVAMQDNFGKKHLHDPVNKAYLEHQAESSPIGAYKHIDWSHPHVFTFMDYADNKGNSDFVKAIIFTANK